MLTISEVKPGIFHLEFASRIEVAAHFLRFQEFYESPNPSFKGTKGYQLIDYLQWYASEHEGVFSYFEDWAGFNVPAQVIIDCYAGITDRNDHDTFMHILARRALSKYPKAYLIGTSKECPSAIDHEIAHGLFHVNSEYREQALSLIYELPGKVQERLYQAIVDMGYAGEVVLDEMQAYLSTGLSSSLKGLGAGPKLQKPFIQLLQEYLGPKRKNH